MGDADPVNGRIAALDLGEAWVGVAVSDPGGIIASPLVVVPAADLTEYMRGLMREEEIGEILVGVPKTLEGEAGFQARRVFASLEDLKAQLPGMRFVEWDERLSTRVAASRAGDRVRRRGGRGGRRRRKDRERLDHLAAAEMLQEYLKAKANP